MITWYLRMTRLALDWGSFFHLVGHLAKALEVVAGLWLTDQAKCMNSILSSDKLGCKMWYTVILCKYVLSLSLSLSLSVSLSPHHLSLHLP